MKIQSYLPRLIEFAIFCLVLAGFATSIVVPGHVKKCKCNQDGNHLCDRREMISDNYTTLEAFNANGEWYLGHDYDRSVNWG